ncbi:MAG: CpsD/CapB family tyrosine-protein kinase [Lachnospiraceae bacterium]|nr:CpsD/CapB family tyrosine-protein kinase [Lachnospiraceae bacterium]
MQEIEIKNLGELPYAVEEAMNRLRINVGFMGSDVKKIMVTSTTPNEGKSFIAMQLFAQMARSGMKSLFIDCDLRKSILSDKYGMTVTGADGYSAFTARPQRGTSYCLSHDGEFDDCIYRVKGIPDAYIMPNTDNIVNPSMLFEKNRFSDLLRYASLKYKYVFLDVPPLDLVADGEQIGSKCDGAILVVRGGITSRNMAKHSAMQLERAGCPLLGIVLNRVEGAKGGYYYKKYGGYYGKSKYYGKDKQYYYGKNK